MIINENWYSDTQCLDLCNLAKRVKDLKDFTKKYKEFEDRMH
jgi:hypothetical protein